MVRQIRWRRIEQPVVHHAASERRVLPVNAKGNAQRECSFVDSVAWNYHDCRRTRHDRGKMPVFGQQDPTLFGTARGEFAVREPAGGDDSVVTSCPEPSTEAVQHLVAQEPRHLWNLMPQFCGLFAVMLCPFRRAVYRLDR